MTVTSLVSVFRMYAAWSSPIGVFVAASITRTLPHHYGCCSSVIVREPRSTHVHRVLVRLVCDRKAQLYRHFPRGLNECTV